LIAAAAALALTAVASAAPPAPSTVLHSDSHLALRSDGGRYLAYQDDLSALDVLDTVEHTVDHYDLGEPCQLHDMAANRIISACGVVIDASSGKVKQLPGKAEWLGIGRRWAAGRFHTHTKAANRFFNLHTEKTLVRHADLIPADLDGRTPRRLPNGIEYRRKEGRLTLDAGATLQPPIRSRLTLRRRGRDKPLLRVRQSGLFSNVEFGSGFVSWSNGLVAYGYSVDQRKRFKWTFPDAARDPRRPSVLAAHTRREVFFSVPVADGYDLRVTKRPR
jgi:hypothetical protein